MTGCHIKLGLFYHFSLLVLLLRVILFSLPCNNLDILALCLYMARALNSKAPIISLISYLKAITKIGNNTAAAIEPRDT